MDAPALPVLPPVALPVPALDAEAPAPLPGEPAPLLGPPAPGPAPAALPGMEALVESQASKASTSPKLVMETNRKWQNEVILVIVESSLVKVRC
jgi:hypothetical protein